MPADSGAPRLIADSTGAGVVVGDVPWWSEDGRAIYTRRADAEGHTSFWTIPLDGGSPRQIYNFAADGLAPARGGWGLYRNQVVFTAPEQRGDIWVLEVGAP